MMSALMVRWDPYWMGASRYICTLPFLLIALWLSSGPGRLIPVGLPWRKIWILGVFGIGGFGILFGLGIQSSGPVMSAVIMRAVDSRSGRARDLQSTAAQWHVAGDESGMWGRCVGDGRSCPSRQVGAARR